MYLYARSSIDHDLRAAISSVASEQLGTKAEVALVLAGDQRMLHFVGTHLFDLQVVLEGMDHPEINS